MKKYLKTIILNFFIIMLTVLLCGCWDLKDINEKTISTTIAFDYKDGEIILYGEAANIQTGTSTTPEQSQKKFNVIKVRGKTLVEMRDHLDHVLDNPIYLSGNIAIIMTEDFANKYLLEYLYRYRADESYRKKVDLSFTKQNLDELFEISKEKDVSLGIYINAMSETLDGLGQSFSRTAERIIENLSSPYCGILIPSIGVRDNEITLVGYSVLLDDKIVGFISTDDAKDLMLLKADRPKLYYDVLYKDFKYTTEVTLKKRKVNPSFSNGKISFEVRLELDAKLMYGDKKTPYKLEQKDLIKAGAILSDMLKEELENSIKQAQNEFNCDYLQFDDIFRIKYPEEFEKIDWHEQFSDIDVTVDIKVDMKTDNMSDYTQDQKN
ncbi:MAG: Ger(x)C family spore germination protein [Eubacteriaceae bacterium]